VASGVRNYDAALRPLRDDIQFLTDRLDPNRHAAAVENLLRTHVHSIERVTTEPAGMHGYNCFMYALGIRQLPGPLIPIAAAIDRANITSEFVAELLQDSLHQVVDDDAQEGKLAMYFNDAGALKHAALCEPDGRFTSKWGTGLLWRHPPFETPSNYGNEIRFYQTPNSAALLRRFREFVERVSGRRVAVDGID
jgi:hypothetical protein